MAEILNVSWPDSVYTPEQMKANEEATRKNGPGPYIPLMDQLQQQGIEIHTLQELQADSDCPQVNELPGFVRQETWLIFAKKLRK